MLELEKGAVIFNGNVLGLGYDYKSLIDSPILFQKGATYALFFTFIHYPATLLMKLTREKSIVFSHS